MEPAIYLDIDGVLADFHGALCDLYGVDRVVSNEIKGWDIPDMTAPIASRLGYEITVDDFWDEIKCAGVDWWVNLPVLPWAHDLYDLCSQYGHVTFMTAPAQEWDEEGHPHCVMDCLPGKVMWIEKNFPSARRYAITNVKHHMSHRGALLIDDSPSGCAKFREFAGNAYLFPRPWTTENWQERQPLAEVSALLQDLSNRASGAGE